MHLHRALKEPAVSTALQNHKLVHRGGGSFTNGAALGDKR